ncbi:hypothetical protein FA10DRAFT_173046 [Acaromyces ingoldii]|uniref:Condensation domain-containing protein n=1 Tax=Acaromyces ingoldii TaxID=215250 RepID=A0A316YJ16_9BASI|nr:hypothetical protein FA10DRAFT_173046 [Acaromyces ingoldii]PWN88814.1 hypothetical protein FA10DRAFT_173046 [Acaromyces ingoldii]
MSASHTHAWKQTEDGKAMQRPLWGVERMADSFDRYFGRHWTIKSSVLLRSQTPLQDLEARIRDAWIATMFFNPLLGADLVADPDAPPANRLLRYEAALSPERASGCFHHERGHGDLAGCAEALRVSLMDASATSPARLAHLYLITSKDDEHAFALLLDASHVILDAIGVLKTFEAVLKHLDEEGMPGKGSTTVHKHVFGIPDSQRLSLLAKKAGATVSAMLDAAIRLAIWIVSREDLDNFCLFPLSTNGREYFSDELKSSYIGLAIGGVCCTISLRGLPRDPDALARQLPALAAELYRQYREQMNAESHFIVEQGNLAIAGDKELQAMFGRGTVMSHLGILERRMTTSFEKVEVDVVDFNLAVHQRMPRLYVASWSLNSRIALQVSHPTSFDASNPRAVLDLAVRIISASLDSL